MELIYIVSVKNNTKMTKTMEDRIFHSPEDAQVFKEYLEETYGYTNLVVQKCLVVEINEEYNAHTQN